MHPFAPTDAPTDTSYQLVCTSEEEIQRFQKTLAMLKYKCWYYETAIQDGNEDRINTMLPDGLPPEIQALYDLSHK